MSDLFNEKSKDWDAKEMVLQLSSAIGSAILQNVKFDDHMQVMDLGAGTGLISSHVAPRVKCIVAVDTSAAMLGKLAAKPELQGKVEVVCQDITQDPLDTEFDVIMSAMAMHHVEDTELLFRRFFEHLKPGATLAVADLDSEDGSFHPADTEGVFHQGFDRSALREIMQNLGFEDIHFVSAHTVNREGRDYPVFLAIAKKAETGS